MNLSREKKSVVTTLLSDYSGESDRLDWVMSKTPNLAVEVQEASLKDAPELMIRLFEAAREISTASREEIGAILTELDATESKQTVASGNLDELFEEANDANAKAMDYFFGQLDKLNDDLGLMYSVADQSTTESPELEVFISEYSAKRVEEIASEAREMLNDATQDLDLKVSQTVIIPNDISSLVVGE